MKIAIKPFVKLMIFLAVSFMGSLLSDLNAADLTSPDGRIRLLINTEEFSYRIFYDKHEVVSSSRWGYGVADALLIKTSYGKKDMRWKPVWGQDAEIRDYHRSMLLEFRSDTVRFDLECRAYNDGVAFRVLMKKSPGELVEKFQISLPADIQCWSFNHPWGMDCQEGETVSKIKSANTPITFQSTRAYFSFHEAALIDYPPMFLAKDSKTGFKGTFRKSYQLKPAFTSPWRVFTLGRTPGDLVRSKLILNLNEPCQIKETSWIKPGASVWDWRVHGAEYEGFTYGLNTASMKRLIDFASEKGIPYAMVDAGWYGEEHSKDSNPLTCIDAIDVPSLAKYAREKGVGLWLYINDKALRHWDLEKTLSSYRQWGAVGIKHGFLSSPTQDGASFSLEVLKKCAKHQLLYDCHEAVKPTGLRRTWPNFLACEYMHSLVDGPKNPVTTPSQICTVPFLHNLAGPLDRTPGMFDLNGSVGRKYVLKEIPSTICNQLAQSIVIFSGLLSLPDAPEAYRQHGQLFEFYRNIPMDWDETRVLHGDIGRLISIARRKGKSWYIASCCDEKGTTLPIPLDFLTPGYQYKATIYQDGENAHYLKQRESYRVRTQKVNKGDRINAVLAPGGGHCMVLEMIQPMR